MVNAKVWLQDIGQEFAGAQLGDARRSGRLRRVARAAVRSPDAGFPQMVESDSELEGVYRFLGNEEVTAEAILRPHLAATMKRAQEAELCLVVHDTTDFKFRGTADRQGLGMVGGSGQGFYGHFALAVLPGKARLPLGICGFERVNRQVRKDTVRKRHSFYIAKDPTRESLRWLRVLKAVESQRQQCQCIHVMDREADMFDLMSLAHDLGARFVIRGDKERALVGQVSFVADLLGELAPQTYRHALLSPRVPTRRHQTIKPLRGKSKQRFVPRPERVAKLSIGSSVVEFRRPRTAHSDLRSLKVNLVYAWEAAPPKGEVPVDWVLFTTEPIDTPEQLHSIIDHYQSRWLIEEYFKALKTGCAFEKRQLESYHSLSNALAVFSVIAWRMLLLRAISRTTPTAKATTVLSQTQLRLICHRLKLSNPLETALDALLAVARLGGHIRNNGDPGWLTLGRGYEKLLLLEAGWQAAADQILGEDVINP